jgi:hypothetical protein
MVLLVCTLPEEKKEGREIIIQINKCIIYIYLFSHILMDV